MAWIDQVPVDEATGLLRKIYDAGTERAGQVANIIKIMSLRPRPLSTFMNLYLQLMKQDFEISPTERELLATVTSEVNGCFY